MINDVPDFDEIAERITPDQLANALGAEKVGSGYRCLRTERHAHGDRNPSFSVYRWNDRTWAKCHGCGLRGTPVQVAGEIWDCTLPKAGRSLARKIGVGNRRG